MKIAIVGTGNSVSNHLTAIQAVGERVELVAAVDLNEDRVQAVSQKHGIPHWYTNVTEMLAKEQPQLVCVVTPPATHKQIAIECMEAGAWVYCEKPLVASLAEFDEIAAAELRTGCFVSTVAQWRFGSAGQHLKSLINTEAFGKPLVAICNTLWFRPQAYYNVEWRGTYKKEFGGPTMTLGIHLMDMLLWLMGGWQDVHAMIGTLDRDIQVEDVSVASVRFQNGAMGSMVNSVLSPRQETYLRLDFQQVTLELSALYRYANENWTISPAPNANEAEVRAHWGALTNNSSGSHDNQLREILDNIEQNERPSVSGEEARRILEFAASLYKSALTGQVVHHGEINPDDPFYYAMNGSGEALSRI